jgi:hypothetical protein
VEKLKITEADNIIIHSWYQEAEKQTLETLMDFINKLINEYEHDYGTICNAMAASAIATLNSVNKSPVGGISGFQSSGIMWLFIQNWMGLNAPLRLLNFEEMLYPQNESKFEKIIPSSTFEFLQNRANELLKEKNYYLRPGTELHWHKIKNGIVPFGYRIDENKK